MLTWKFWSALRKPPENHPLYKRLLATRYIGPKGVNGQVFMWMVCISVFGLCWSVAFTWIPMLLLLSILLTNTAYSLVWSLRVSHTIVAEKEQNRLDLISVMPGGALGANWALCVGELHRNQYFIWLHFIVRLLTTVILLTLFGALFLTMLIYTGEDTTKNASQFAVNNSRLFVYLIFAIAAAFSFYIDHIQSVVLSSLVGIYATSNTNSRNEVRVRALGGFLLAQLSVYAICGIICFNLIPQLYLMIGNINIPGALFMALLSITIFYGMREIFITLLWRSISRTLNTDDGEFKDIALQMA